jgi:hypothetical protein
MTQVGEGGQERDCFPTQHHRTSLLTTQAGEWENRSESILTISLLKTQARERGNKNEEASSNQLDDDSDRRVGV